MDIIELAKQAEFTDLDIAISYDNFARFAELVAAHEREECAKLAATPVGTIASAIRARGTT